MGRFISVHDLETNFSTQQIGHTEYFYIMDSDRSIMKALSAMQLDWAEYTEEKMKAGVLFWDLPVAYDTMHTGLLCEKLRCNGLDAITCQLFRSVLTGRVQRVKILATKFLGHFFCPLHKKWGHPCFRQTFQEGTKLIRQISISP